MSNNRYYGRNTGIISRDLSSTDKEYNKEPSWFDEFVENLEKNAVQSREKDSSTYDQISQILGKKSKYSSVEEAVQDMRKRTGLEAFLNAKAESEKKSKKTASTDVEPVIFKSLPKVKIFIDNFVSDRPGIAIEAVVHALELYFNKDINKEELDDDLRSYINNKIQEVKSMHPEKNDADNMEIGKLDTNDSSDIELNSDVFQGCMPAKV